MPQDIHGQFSAQLFNKDRQGHVTPDNEASEILRPYLPVAYPAPWLPGRRQDDAHPILAQVVISHQQLVGLDKSGALVPAGLKCGNSGAGLDHANGEGYVALKYSQADVDFGAINPFTGAQVTAGEVVYIAAPNDGVNTDVITFPDGTTDSPSSGEITAAKACDLFNDNIAKPIGVAVRNIWQYMGGTNVSSTTNGIKYTLDGMIPVKWKFTGYMNEMGTAIQTSFYLRLPWIGNDTDDLQAVATGLSITGYTQSNYSRSFAHFTGAKGTTGLHLGCLVKASELLGDAGNYAPFNVATDKLDRKVGKVIAIQEVYPAKDYLNRVKTLWDNSKLGGAMRQPSQAAIMMGGSQTAGIAYELNLATDALLKKALEQGKTPDPKMYTFVYVLINLA